MKVRIFTDGACSENPGPGGWAAVFNTDKDCKVLQGHDVQTTNNRMELTAIVKAMEKVYNNGKAKNIYELYSDSAYVVNAVNHSWVDAWEKNGWKTTRSKDIKNKDLWQRYVEVRNGLKAKDIELEIKKVKGHAGNSFNEYADKIAKEEVLKAKKIRRGDCHA